MSVLERLPNVSIVHHVQRDGSVWGSRGRTVLCKRNGVWRPVARFPVSMPRDLFGWNRPMARASRADKCNVYVNSRGRMLGIRAHAVYSLEPDGSLVRRAEIQGDCVLHRGICEDWDGWTYFGEYFRNPQRAPVRIWRFSPELHHHEIAHEFPAGSIRHVHCVLSDPYDDDALWVTVGDYSGECYVLRTRDRFGHLERFGDGSQTWRAVVLFFTPDYVAWLTDSHLDQNHACRMDRRTGTLDVGCPIPCSTWYGTTTTDGMHVAFTTVERGPAIHRSESLVLVSDDAFRWHEVGSFRKDAWRPRKLFKFGVINCPSGPMPSGRIYISGEGLVGFDGLSLRIGVERMGWAP
jgi:hypothetical protein